MSSVSVRPSTTTTDVGYGEQEQDANSALLELDKGNYLANCCRPCLFKMPTVLQIPVLRIFRCAVVVYFVFTGNCI